MPSTVLHTSNKKIGEQGWKCYSYLRLVLIEMCIFNEQKCEIMHKYVYMQLD